MKTVALIMVVILGGMVCRAADTAAPAKAAAETKDAKAVKGGDNAAAAKADGMEKASAETTEVVAVSESEKEHTYFDEFMHKMEQGGFTMKILLVLSIVGIAKIFERAFNLNRSTIATPGLAEEANSLFRQGRYDELCSKCRSDTSILGHIVLSMVEHRECSKGDIQSISDDIGSREMRIQMQKSYPLAIVATLSPLLGLFGTVLGMIGAFDTVAQAGDMGNASILADDIATALVTTGGGLAVAIPMLGFYHYFRTRTNKYAIILEEEVSALYSAWFLRPAAIPQAVSSESSCTGSAAESKDGCGCGCAGEGDK